MPILWAITWLGVDATGYWLDGDVRVRRGHGLRDRVRDRRVLSRSRAPGARRRARRRTPSRSLLRAALDVVGARRRRRAGDRRADPRRRAVCALAARGGRLPCRSRGALCARASRSRALSPHSSRGARRTASCSASWSRSPGRNAGVECPPMTVRHGRARPVPMPSLPRIRRPRRPRRRVATPPTAASR